MINQATKVSKYINLLIQFGQKIDYQLHKKYRPFVRSILNLQSLARHANTNKATLTIQIIIFKLGLQSKSNKCIEISLNYLYRLFQLNAIDLNLPNYCQNYIIEQNGVKQTVVQKYQRQMRHQMIKLLEPLVHFKSQAINQLLLKNYEYLIGQPILASLLQICQLTNSQLALNILFSYYGYRAYLYQQFNLYKQYQFQSINAIIPHTQKLDQMIKKAECHNDKFIQLIEKYTDAIVDKIVGDGGKYGYCVICGEPAEHFCKVTKVSLCGIQCKRVHLEMSDSFYKQYLQNIRFKQQLLEFLKSIIETLTKKDSLLLSNVLVNITERPYLFMLVQLEFRELFRRNISKAISNLYQSKNQAIFANIYHLMGNLTRFYTLQTLSQVHFFLKNNIIVILQQKKPKFSMVMLVLRTLAKIFQNGKTIVELYVNFDCQLNQENAIQKIMFELARISQDKFANYLYLDKNQKITLKNFSITLYQIFVTSLNQYRKLHPKQIPIDPVLAIKHRKTSLEKFAMKFNANWITGLKSLFNMNIVGLQSTEQIIDIITTSRGLKKQQIDLMIFSQAGQAYLQCFISKIHQKINKSAAYKYDSYEGLLQMLLQYYRFLPFKKGTLSQKIFIDCLRNEKGKNLPDEEKRISQWLTILPKLTSFEEFNKSMHLKYKLDIKNTQIMYMLLLQCKSQFTVPPHSHYYTHCSSSSYVSLMSSQISLIQIPLSYLIQTNYEVDKVLNLFKELVQICPQANWLTLLIKNSFLQTNLKSQDIGINGVKIVRCILQIVSESPKFINDWINVLGFMCNLHRTLVAPIQTNKRNTSQNQQFLAADITVTTLQRALLLASQALKAKQFTVLMNSILQIARQQLRQQGSFMLQKYFQILNYNMPKYCQNFKEDILEQFLKFIKQLSAKKNLQSMIYVVDMLKQSLAKLLKTQNCDSMSVEIEYFKLLQTMLHQAEESRELGDFIMNSISMLIMHHYQLQSSTWNIILSILLKNSHKYRYQSSIIIQKLISKKLGYCEHNMQMIIDICLKMVDRRETKYSVEALHYVKNILDFIQIKETKENSNIQQERSDQGGLQKYTLQQTKNIYKNTLKTLIGFISYQCHQNAIEIIFIILQHNLVRGIFTKDDLNFIFKHILSTLSTLPNQLVGRGQKIMSESLYWSVKHQYHSIIYNLEEFIFKDFGHLSQTAAKCLKTFIQMVNPKQQQEWKYIEEVLIRIIQQTSLSKALPVAQQIDTKTIQKLTYKLMIQKLAVEMLPNDHACKQIIEQIYQQSIEFNDNISFRCQLWRKGFGLQGLSAPNILNLQQVLSNRILAILNSKGLYKQMLSFGLKILLRYEKASIILNKLQSKGQEALKYNSTQYEMYQIQLNYWQTRRIPLIKILAFLLPKVNKLCEGRDDKIQLVKGLSRILPYCQKREHYIKAIKDLTTVKVA